LEDIYSIHIGKRQAIFELDIEPQTPLTLSSPTTSFVLPANKELFLEGKGFERENPRFALHKEWRAKLIGYVHDCNKHPESSLDS